MKILYEINETNNNKIFCPYCGNFEFATINKIINNNIIMCSDCFNKFQISVSINIEKIY